MASRKYKIDAAQTTISHVFTTATKVQPIAEDASKTTDLYVSKKLTSSDSRVQAFYNSLSPAETVAHSIAVEKLGTSYDVSRTHGFLRWCKANPAPK